MDFTDCHVILCGLVSEYRCILEKKKCMDRWSLSKRLNHVYIFLLDKIRFDILWESGLENKTILRAINTKPKRYLETTRLGHN